ncbi:hypothetical protein M758_6G148000 [Ceratodon purpureus]|nr:hypothetical protein M758_6G148000 [Ceratodon purpureus]
MECPLVGEMSSTSAARRSTVSGMAEHPTASATAANGEECPAVEPEDLPMLQESVNQVEVQVLPCEGTSSPECAVPSAIPSAQPSSGAEGASGPIPSTPLRGMPGPRPPSRRCSTSASGSRNPAPTPARRSNPCHSVKGTLRRRCRVCKIRTFWICPGCRLRSMCPGRCFLDFHGSALL